MLVQTANMRACRPQAKCWRGQTNVAQFVPGLQRLLLAQLHEFCAAGVWDRVNIRDVQISRLPERIFDAYRRAKLNQNPACRELQIRLKNGPKWPQKQFQNTKFEKNFPEGIPSLLCAYTHSHILGQTNSILLPPGLCGRDSVSAHTQLTISRLPLTSHVIKFTRLSPWGEPGKLGRAWERG